jgi:uncharacterized membrane protein YesL
VRAFLVVGRAVVSFYNDLFLLIGMSLLWWITGGIFVGLAAFMVVAGLQAATSLQNVPVADASSFFFRMAPLCLIPLFAIPAGPATAALANVARQSARDLRADSGFYWEGFRMYWKKALGVNAISMVVLSLLLLNLVFYLSRTKSLVQALAFLWAYLVIFWMGVVIYQAPVLVGLQEPKVVSTLRTAIAMAFANPLFSILIVILAVALTGLSVALAILLVLAWPAVMALLGEHSLKLFVELVRGPQDQQGENT